MSAKNTHRQKKNRQLRITAELPIEVEAMGLEPTDKALFYKPERHFVVHFMVHSPIFHLNLLI